MNTLLLTIVGPCERADLAAAADAPVGELLASLAEMTAGGDAGARDWELAAAGCAPLLGDRSLAEQRIVDGAILHLRRAGETHVALQALRPAAGEQRDDVAPLRRTRETLPDWTGRAARLGPAACAWARRRRGTDLGRFERARASWRAADYDARLDELIRAPRLRRTATIAVLGDNHGAGASTIAALLATLMAHAGRDLPVVVDRLVDGEPGLRPPARAGLYVLDCAVALPDPAIARPDQIVLVCDARMSSATLIEQAAERIDPATALVVVVNDLSRLARTLDGADVERALPHARGVLGVRHDARRARLVADGTFSWMAPAGGWETELRELAALLACDWQRLGLAAAPLRSAG